MLKSMQMTQHEADVLDAAKQVQFGELRSVPLEKGGPLVTRQVTAEQEAFLRAVRDGGLAFLDHVVVHNECPAQIELEGAYKTIQYIKKVRFIH